MPLLNYIYTLPLHKRKCVLAGCLKKLDSRFTVYEPLHRPIAMSYQAKTVATYVSKFIKKLVEYKWSSALPLVSTKFALQGNTSFFAHDSGANCTDLFAINQFSTDICANNTRLLEILKTCELITKKSTNLEENEMITLLIMGSKYLSLAHSFEEQRLITVGQKHLESSQLLGLLLFNFKPPFESGITNSATFKRMLNEKLMISHDKDTMRMCLEFFLFFIFFGPAFVFIRETVPLQISILKDANIGLVMSVFQDFKFQPLEIVRLAMAKHFKEKTSSPKIQKIQELLALRKYGKNTRKMILDLIF